MGDRATIAVLGVGAIGGAVAAALGDAGHRLTLCVRTPFLRLSRTLGAETSHYEHPVYTQPDELSHHDWVLLCTKAHQIDGAAHWLHRLVGPHTRVAVMQNGVDHMDRVSTHVAAERTVPCIMMLPAHVVRPGVVEQARAGTVQVPDTEAGRGLAELFGDQDGIRVEPTADFVSALWSKLVSNAVGGAICALALKPLGAVAAAQVHALATGLMEEVVRVGEAEGATFPKDFVTELIGKYRGPIGGHWTSMAADRRDGRPMEWEARNAVVGVVGRRHGIPTPLNDALTALLALIDAPTA